MQNKTSRYVIILWSQISVAWHSMCCLVPHIDVLQFQKRKNTILRHLRGIDVFVSRENPICVHRAHASSCFVWSCYVRLLPGYWCSCMLFTDVVPSCMYTKPSLQLYIWRFVSFSPHFSLSLSLFLSRYRSLFLVFYFSFVISYLSHKHLALHVSIRLALKHV